MHIHGKAYKYLLRTVELLMTKGPSDNNLIETLITFCLGFGSIIKTGL